MWSQEEKWEDEADMELSHERERKMRDTNRMSAVSKQFRLTGGVSN